MSLIKISQLPSALPIVGNESIIINQEGNTRLTNVNEVVGIVTFVQSSGISSALTSNASVNTSGIITASAFSGELEHTLTLNTTGTGISGSATFNNSDNSTFTVTSNATSNNLSNTIVSRDSSGSFIAGIITATEFNGNVIGNITGDLTGEINTATFSTNESGVVVTGIATAAGFSGDLVGNVTGDATGLSGTPDINVGIVTASSLTLSGDLTVNGTTTTLNTETLQIEDKNIELGLINSPTNITADGGGITLKGTTDKTWNWINSTNSWTSSENIDIFLDKVYKINGIEVLSLDTLGSSIVNSSLISVGTLQQLSVSGVTTSSGGFVGNLTGNVTGDLTGNVTGDLTGNVNGDLTGEVNATAFDTNESGVVVTGIATAAGFSGDLTGNVNGDLTGEVNATAFDTNESGVVVTGIATAAGFSGDLTGNVTGNSDTATALQNARNFEITGDIIGSPISFDGTGNVSIAATIQPNSVALGDKTTGNYVATINGTIGEIDVSGSGSESASVTIGLPNIISISGVNASGIITASSVNSSEILVSGISTFNEDVSVGVNTSHGIILTSPGGLKYRLIVDDNGVLDTTLVT